MDMHTSDGTPRERTAETVVLPTQIALDPNPTTIVANGSDRSILTARVTDELDRPLPDGTPVLFTADKGTFENGGGRITVSIAGGNGEAVTYLTAPILSKSDTARAVASFGGFDSDVVNLEVTPGAVAVRVYDQKRGVTVTAGDPDLGVEVKLVGKTVTGESVSYTVTVDEKGMFVIPEIPPGNYELQARVTDSATGRVISDGVLQKVEVNFDGSTTPARNAISGMVRGRDEESGARYAGTTVELLDEHGAVVATSALDSEGRYDFQDQPPGDYTLQARLPDGTRVTKRVAPLCQTVGAVVVNADILIDPFGRVFDVTTGAGVPDATVTLQTLTGETLPIPLLDGTGAKPNFNNINPFVSTAAGEYAFLFGGDQVGSLDNPVTYIMAVTPPTGPSYLPRQFYLAVQPSRAGPVDQVPITMSVTAADGLEMAQPNSFALTADPVVVPNIETIAFNIPLFKLAPVITFTNTSHQDTVTTGQPVDFRLMVANAGNDTARNVTVVDTLSAGWRLLDAGEGTTAGPNIVQWTLGDLLPGGQDTLGLRAEAVPPQPEGIVLTNRAWVQATGLVPIGSEAGVVIQSGPVWTLTTRASVDSMMSGQEIEYTITYGNEGTHPGVRATLVDSLPPELTPVAAPGGTIDGQVVTWPLGDVAAGQQDSVILTARTADFLPTGERVVSVAVIRDADGRTAATASSVVPTRPPRLSLIKQADADTVMSGDEVVFSLIVNNEDSVPVPAATTLIDSLPPALEFISATGNATVSGNAVVWTLGPLAAGATDTARVTARVVSDAAVVNTARLLYAGGEAIGGARTATVAVRRIPSLWLTKSADGSVVKPGEVIRYEIAVGSSADTLRQVTVRDTLPADLAYEEGSGGPSAVYDGPAHALSWTLPEVLPGTPQTLRFGLTPREVLPPGEHETQNVAVASLESMTFASNPVDLVISVPFLSVQKAADPTVAETGDFVVYRVTLENLSPTDSLTAVEVRDRLPYGFDYVKATARLDGRPLAPDTLRGRNAVWRFSGLGAGETRQLTYRAVLGSDAESGDGTNVVMASATSLRGYTLAADPARAKVRVRPDLFARGEVILGRAWVDLNGDGLHNEGEPPVPEIALMMEDGTRILADRQGRFSIPEVTPGDHVLRLLEWSIAPDLDPVALGTRSAFDPWIRFVTVSPSGMAKANFPFRQMEAPGEIHKTVRTVAPPLRVWLERTVVRRDSVATAPRSEELLTLGHLSFASGSAGLATTVHPLLRDFAARLKTHPEQPILVSGHTDSIAISNEWYSDNTTLSMARAEAVKTWLESAGIDSARITTRGYGESRPVASNRLPEGRRKNRRVEIERLEARVERSTLDRFAVILKAQMLGTQPDEPFKVLQDIPDRYRLSPQDTVKVRTVGSDDSVTCYMAADVNALLDLSPPGLEHPAVGPLPLRFVGQDTSSALRDLWVGEMSVPASEDSEGDTVRAGVVLAYDISVLAPGGGQVLDLLPPGITFLAADSLAEVRGDTVRWKLSTSAPPETLSLWTRVQVNPDHDGDLKNRAILLTPAPRNIGGLTPGPEDSATVRVLPRPSWTVSTTTVPETLFVEEKPEELLTLGHLSFASGSARLATTVYPLLRDFAARLKTHPGQPVLVSGHTDSIAISNEWYSDNTALSMARAEAVKAWLVSAGIDSARIVTRGYGPTRPVASNRLPQGRRENRRVEIERRVAHEELPVDGVLTRTTTAIYRGAEPVPRVQLADSLGIGMTYRAGTASIPPLVGERALVWSWQDVQPGDSLKVVYQAHVKGKLRGVLILPIRSVVSYGLPDGQWIAEPAVTGKISVVVPVPDLGKGGAR